jgi:tRNA modification GTPase
LTAPETSTTRDLLTGVWALDSLRVALSDGPGEDFSATPLAEKLRGRNAATRPNFALLLLVLDGTAAPDAALARFVRELPPPPLVVIFNKSDLPSAPELEATVKAWLAAAEKKVLAFCQVSAATGAGIDELKTVVSDFARRDVPAGGGRDEVEINAWRGALTAVAQARPQIAAGELALAAFELREADEALRELTGENYAEEILTRVFARFCLGK